MDEIEVTSFTFGEAIVAVKLKFGGNNRVFASFKYTKVGAEVSAEEVTVGKSSESTVAFGSDGVANRVTVRGFVTTSSWVVSVGWLGST